MVVRVVVLLLAAARAEILRRVIVTGGTHGNEYTGVFAVNRLQKRPALLRDYPSLEVEAMLSNTRAHAVGKWHLGHFAHAYTPLQRGFDSFLGFYSGFEDYFVHVAEMTECFVEADCFYDLRDDTRPVKSAEFNVKLFNRRAAEIVRDHAPDAPLFLYYAIPLVHAPMEAPHDVLMRHHDLVKLCSEVNPAQYDPLQVPAKGRAEGCAEAARRLSVAAIQESCAQRSMDEVQAVHPANLPTMRPAGDYSTWPLPCSASRAHQ